MAFFMDCAQITELLPWHLNGTLSAAQRAEISTHLAQCAACQRAWEETRVALQAAQQHVHEDILTNYIWQPQALAENHRALIERHLAACADCSEEAALLRESFALQEERVRVLAFRPRASSASPAAYAWRWGAIAAGLLGLFALGGLWQSWRQNRALQTQLAQLSQRRDARLDELAAENQRLRQATATPTNETESAQQIARLETRIRELSAAHPNVPVLEVFPAELTQRDGAGMKTKLVIPAKAARVALILNAQSTVAANAYQLEIRDGQQRSVTVVTGLRRNATGDYTLSLPADLLPPGTYRFALFGKVAGRRTQVESYPVQVSRP
jgi:hypothetical protein